MAENIGSGTGGRGYISIIVAGEHLLTEKNFDTVEVPASGKAGLLVEWDTYPNTKLRATNGSIAGVLLEKIVRDETDDIDTATADGEYWLMLKFPFPVGVRVTLFHVGDSEAIVIGSPIVASDAGVVKLHNYADTAEETDMAHFIVGTAVEAFTGAATAKVIVVEGGLRP